MRVIVSNGAPSLPVSSPLSMSKPCSLAIPMIADTAADAPFSSLRACSRASSSLTVRLSTVTSVRSTACDWRAATLPVTSPLARSSLARLFTVSVFVFFPTLYADRYASDALPVSTYARANASCFGVSAITHPFLQNLSDPSNYRTDAEYCGRFKTEQSDLNRPLCRFGTSAHKQESFHHGKRPSTQ